MADLVIAGANVLAVSGASIKSATAGAQITAAGKSIYLDATDSDKAKLADANGGAGPALCRGIALHAAEVGQPLQYIDGGQLDVGVILTAGQMYVLSATPGGIAPVTDLISGMVATLVAIALTTSRMEIHLASSNVALT